MKLQSRRSPENARFWDSHAGVPGVPGQNGHLDATPAASHRVYYKGEGGGFPQGPGHGESCVSVLPVALSQHQRDPKMSSNHFVWFHAGPCE